jgi:tRNA A58 N-methylase Trm61
MKVFHLNVTEAGLNNPITSRVYGDIVMLGHQNDVNAILLDLHTDLSYKFVATVDCDTLNQAFKLTNSIDCYWGDNEGVVGLSKCRSTCVGDIIEDNTGKRFLVAMFGFEELV